MSNVLALTEVSPRSFWSLVREDSLLESAHLSYPRVVNSWTDLLEILKQHDRPTMVMFYKAGCKPCYSIESFFKKKAQVQGVPALRIDVADFDPRDKFNTPILPEFKVLDASGKELWRKTGGNPSVVTEGLEAAKK